MISKLVAKFWATRSMPDKKETKKRHILAKKILDKIGAHSTAGPKK
jgi:hypothetical protein